MGLLKFVGKKLLMMIPMLLLISFIVFAGLQATGIDPINYMITPDKVSRSFSISLSVFARQMPKTSSFSVKVWASTIPLSCAIFTGLGIL